MEVIDVHRAYLDRLSSGWHSEKVSLVGSAQSELRDDLIAFGDGLINCPLNVWIGRSHHAKDLHVPIQPLHWFWGERYVKDGCFRYNFFADRHIA